MTKKESIFKRKPLMMYFILAFVFTWLILAPGVASTLGVIDFQYEGTVLTIASGIGPLLAAIVVTRATDGSAGVGKIFQSMFNWRASAKWWGAAVLLLAGLFGIAALLNNLTGGVPPNPRLGVYLQGGSLILVILLLLIGSFGEEPGWRGFALPRLQEKFRPMKATLILTFFWWLWHLPTYWTLPMAMEAVQQSGFVVTYIIQFIVLLALGILCTWVFNGSGGSVLMPVLMHASWNFWIGALGQGTSMFLLPLFLVTAIVVSFATKGKLGLRPADEIG